MGPLRTGEGLAEALQWFKQWEYLSQYDAKDVVGIEVRNMLTAGKISCKGGCFAHGK